MPTVRGRKLRVLFDADAIRRRNADMAREIAAAGYRDLLVVSILKGSFVFAADLIRALHDAGLEPEVEFLALSSYGEDTVSSGQVRVVRDIETDVRGRDVLIVDDILESGRTLAFARDLMRERGARRVAIAVLLDKRGRRAAAVEADHVGFDCPDYFVVGYGMDVAHAFRELPYVGVIEDAPDAGTRT
jgi:hypoxanthine phosphoribosyltransferase